MSQKLVRYIIWLVQILAFPQNDWQQIVSTSQSFFINLFSFQWKNNCQEWKSSRLFTMLHFLNNVQWYSSGKLQWKIKTKSCVLMQKMHITKKHKPLALHMPTKIHLFLFCKHIQKQGNPALNFAQNNMHSQWPETLFSGLMDFKYKCDLFLKVLFFKNA